MKLLLKRILFNDTNTLGTLYIDGVFECYTLEDVVRERRGIAVSTWKIKGETAIPVGTYKVARTMSARLKRILPLLIGVSGYAGIRIHPGNTEKDTEGCILVGQAKTEVSVTASRAAFGILDQKIKAALVLGREVWITVEGLPM